MGQQQQDGKGVFRPLEENDPRTVAGYRLTTRLGSAGMGKVYLSYTPGGRPVAVKVIRPDFAETAAAHCMTVDATVWRNAIEVDDE